MQNAQHGGGQILPFPINFDHGSPYNSHMGWHSKITVENGRL